MTSKATRESKLSFWAPHGVNYSSCLIKLATLAATASSCTDSRHFHDNFDSIIDHVALLPGALGSAKRPRTDTVTPTGAGTLTQPSQNRSRPFLRVLAIMVGGFGGECRTR